MAAFEPLGALQTPIDLFAAFWVWVCFAAIASLLIFLFIAIWLYKDAESRGMSGGLWVLILLIASFLFSFVGGLVVLVIYLIVRMEHPMGAMPYGYGPGGYPPAYPPYPAAPPPAPPAAPAAAVTPAACKSCGAPLHPGAAFCANCGSKV